VSDLETRSKSNDAADVRQMLSSIYWVPIIVISFAEAFIALGILAILAYAAPSEWRRHRDERRAAAKLKAEAEAEARADKSNKPTEKDDESISPYGTHGSLYFAQDAPPNYSNAMIALREPPLFGGDGAQSY
jgi:hypothetical protein